MDGSGEEVNPMATCSCVAILCLGLNRTRERRKLFRLAHPSVTEAEENHTEKSVDFFSLVWRRELLSLGGGSQGSEESGANALGLPDYPVANQKRLKDFNYGGLKDYECRIKMACMQNQKD